MQIDGGSYGLISGWRRLNALRRLRDEECGMDQVLALLRRPEQAGDAYQAMIEENEIRVGLSYFERARIVQKSVENGVFETEKAALRVLFASASPAKRSKIKSFMSIVRHLDGALIFPEALGERAGLALVKVLEEDPKRAADLRKALVKAAPQDAMAELRVLQTVPRTIPAPRTETKSPEVAPLSVEVDVLEDGNLRLHGDGVTPALRAKLQAWLAKQRV